MTDSINVASMLAGRIRPQIFRLFCLT
jgi:hypothetical protein